MKITATITIELSPEDNETLLGEEEICASVSELLEDLTAEVGDIDRIRVNADVIPAKEQTEA